MEACTGRIRAPKGPTDARDALNCEMVTATVEAAHGRKDSATEHLARAIALVAFVRADLNLTLSASSKADVLLDEIVRALIEQLSRGRFPDRNKLSPLEKVSSPKVAQLLTLSLQDLAFATQRGTTTHDLSAAIALKLIDVNPLNVTITRANQPTITRDVREVLTGLREASLPRKNGESIAMGVVRAILENESVAPHASVKVTWNGKTLNLDVTERPGDLVVGGAGLRGLERLFRGERSAEKLEARVDDLSSSTTRLAVAVALIRVGGDIVAVAKGWERALKESDGLPSPKRLLDVIKAQCAAAPTAPRSAGPTQPIDVCQMVKQAGAIYDPTGQLAPLVSAALEGDLRKVATAAVRGVFSSNLAQRVCCGDPDESECIARVDAFGNLATSFVSYATLKEGDDNGEAAARAAFKRAAYDVVTDLGSRKGFERPPSKRIFIPNASLRASVSQSYINEGNDGYRYLATIDWPTFSIVASRRESVRVEVQVSLTDILAPISEFAFRDINITYDQSGLVFANVLKPNVDIDLGIPALTTKLMLQASTSWRPFIPKKNPKDKENYKYLFSSTSFEGDQADWEGVLRSLEFGIGVKYVP